MALKQQLNIRQIIRLLSPPPLSLGKIRKVLTFGHHWSENLIYFFQKITKLMVDRLLLFWYKRVEKAWFLGIIFWESLYYTDSIIFWLITWIWLISRTAFLITWCLSCFDFKFKNQVWGFRRARRAKWRPQVGALSASRLARSAPRPFGIPTPDFQIWNHITKYIMLLREEVRDTQPNQRYSAKNNDAIDIW